MFIGTIDNLIDEELAKIEAPGISLCLMESGSTRVFSRGFADITAGKAMTENGIFDIASIGKLVTVFLILRLVEEKQLDLQAPISMILPQFPSAWKEVTVEHLLTHTSGIENYTATRQYWDECRLDVSKERIIGYVTDSELQFTPGSRWDYNNTGFFLLGLVIEKITGQGYFDYATAMLTSFGIQGFYQTAPSLNTAQRVSGYTVNDGGNFVNVPYYSNSGTFSAGGFSVRLNDFLHFENLLFNGHLLSLRSLRFFLSPVRLNGDKDFLFVHPDMDFEMCHGIFLLRKQQKSVYAHGGATSGFSSSYIRVSEDDVSMIVAANRDGLSDQLLKLLLRLFETMCEKNHHPGAANNSGPFPGH